jgi:hypothetical protein
MGDEPVYVLTKIVRGVGVGGDTGVAESLADGSAGNERVAKTMRVGGDAIDAHGEKEWDPEGIRPTEDGEHVATGAEDGVYLKPNQELQVLNTNSSHHPPNCFKVTTGA